MTDDEIRALLELEAKATPGPWAQFDPDTGDYMDDLGITKAGEVDCAPIAWVEPLSDYDVSLNAARLLVASRNALRPLCEEVLRLRAEVTRHSRLVEENRDLKAARELTKADNEIMRADLARHRAVERWAASVCRSREMERTADALLSAAESQWQDVPPEALAGVEV